MKVLPQLINDGFLLLTIGAQNIGCILFLCQKAYNFANKLWIKKAWNWGKYFRQIFTSLWFEKRIIIAYFFLRLCRSGHGNHWHDVLSRTDNFILLSRKVGGFIWQAPHLYRMFIFMCMCLCVFCHKNCLQSKRSATLSVYFTCVSI